MDAALVEWVARPATHAVVRAVTRPGHSYMALFANCRPRIYQINRAALATRNVTAKANTSGITAPTTVHFPLRVSFHIVRIVVAHGLWSKANNIRHTAVSMVQPC